MCVVEPGPVPTTQTKKRVFIESGTVTYLDARDENVVDEKDFSIVLAWNGSDHYTPTRSMAKHKHTKAKMRILSHHLTCSVEIMESFAEGEMSVDQEAFMEILKETTTAITKSFEITEQKLLFQENAASRPGRRKFPSATAPNPETPKSSSSTTPARKSSSKSSAPENVAALCCEKCGEVFADIKLVRIHKYNVHDMGDLENLVCKVCGKDFSNKYHLKDHVKSIHEKNFRHSCQMEECNGWGTNSRQQFDSHMCAKHNIGSVRYCKKTLPDGSQCKKKFFGDNGLVRHQKTCGVDKTFECDSCDKLFKSKGTRATHIDLFHGPSAKFVCHHCQKRFSIEKLLADHIKRLHKDTN